MMTHEFPVLDSQSIHMTKNALHAYARVLGDWTSACRKRRKHWWHASLQPSINGLTTGIIYADINFELELNLRRGLMLGQTSTGKYLSETLYSTPPAEIANRIRDFLIDAGVDMYFVRETHEHNAEIFFGNATEYAGAMTNDTQSNRPLSVVLRALMISIVSA